jgi:hypothetical protein
MLLRNAKTVGLRFAIVATALSFDRNDWFALGR